VRVHDHHLRAYQVLEFGATVILDLIYDYPGQPKLESSVRFNGVELYHFVHATGSILYGIEDVSIDDILAERGGFIEATAHTHGVRGWRDGMENYRSYLKGAGARAWEITSSIGFDGFVIAQSVEQLSA